jgi:hypothetical protein
MKFQTDEKEQERTEETEGLAEEFSISVFSVASC